MEENSAKLHLPDWQFYLPRAIGQWDMWCPAWVFNEIFSCGLYIIIGRLAAPETDEVRVKLSLDELKAMGHNTQQPLLDPDSKVYGANMGPIWGRQDPGGPHVGHVNFAIWGATILVFCHAVKSLQLPW